MIIEPKPYQKAVMDKIISGKKLTGIYRRVRPYGLTIKQLDTFNRVCKDHDTRIQWHSADWVAMDRTSFEKLRDAASKATNNLIIVDEVAK